MNNINKLIDDIIQEIPISNLKLLGYFKSEKQSLAYTAPELVNNYILKIFNILQLHVPWDSDETKNPQWIINIRKIWTAAMTCPIVEKDLSKIA